MESTSTTAVVIYIVVLHVLKDLKKLQISILPEFELISPNRFNAVLNKCVFTALQVAL